MKFVYKIKLLAYENIDDLMGWLVDQTILLYTGSVARNDFVLVHGITSSWALKQIVPHLDKKDQLEALRTFLCGLLAFYLIRQKPEIKRELIFEEPSVEKMSWEDLRKRLLNKNVEEVDEHDFKLFQVCQDQWEKYRRDHMEAVYKRAILSNLDNPF